MMLSKAFVFPGQGSQFLGMLSDLEKQYPIVRDIFSEASSSVGFDVWQLIQEGPGEKLNQTEFTQVAMLVSDVAVYHVLAELELSDAAMMAGHSLGEYAALVCSEALTLKQAAPLVMKRGQLMQQHIPMGEGAMAAIIGLTDQVVKDICDKASDDKKVVSPANYNAIGQVVIAGHTSAVEKAVQLALEAEARMAKIIPVSVPCHCSLLFEAANEFEYILEEIDFKTPICDVISNVDLAVYKTPADIKSRLKRQLYSPVRWVETIQKMKQANMDCIIECGPGKVLTGLVKRIERGMATYFVSEVKHIEQLKPLIGVKV